MRLSKIKLAGFKSFVDPTTIHLPSNLTGIVGPNGCGKSNVIDAVRWVLGESSAKYLRGDSLEDVIFNGSNARKPVGAATIELIFDNADGAIGGAYARYAEISVKRSLARDGNSTYYLNGARCRRKDITGIFLGTGLGPRSYAIIEQGMVSRLIDAKPEDLRIFLEEAAGISRYKDRRRETENRIRHTRENLTRLADLMEEVEKQLKHLQRQSRLAERYKKHRQSERRLRAELLALKLRLMDARIGAEREGLSARQTELDAALAEQRRLEAEIEAAREASAQRQEALNRVQERYYKHGAEIARLEQAIQHGRELRERQTKELEQIDESAGDLRLHMQRDRAQLEELVQSLRSLEPELGNAQAAQARSAEELERSEQALADWQQRWEQVNEELSELEQHASAEQARIEELADQLSALAERGQRLSASRTALGTHELEEEITGAREAEERAQAVLEATQVALASTVERLNHQRERDRRLTADLHAQRSELQAAKGRVASLEALQQAALGEHEGAVTAWLARRGLQDRPRLAQELRVEPGWERAVETVLGAHLEAVCVEGLDPLAGWLDELAEGSLILFEPARGGGQAMAATRLPTLASKLTPSVSCDSLLVGVYAAESLPVALQSRRGLGPGESVITQEGIWIGPDWLRVSHDEDVHAGVIAREKELRELRAATASLSQLVSEGEQQHERVQSALHGLEQEREQLQGKLNAAHSQHVETKARRAAFQSKLQHLSDQIGAIDSDRGELEGRLSAVGQAQEGARERLDAAATKLARVREARRALDRDRQNLRDANERARAQARDDREAAQGLAIKVEAQRSTRDSLQRSLQRLESQMTQQNERRAYLREQLEQGHAPLAEQKGLLNGLLQKRVEIDAELAGARNGLETADLALRELEHRRGEHEGAVQEARETVERVRLAMREVETRRETYAEQFAATDFVLEEVQEALPEDASIEAWEEKLVRVEARIQRLGPINLAAIDEFQAQSERKEYLDAQNRDLTEALETLERAIRRIDRETRTRFKETFDKVDQGLKDIFPRLFGGGHAYLQLTGDDLLSAGVTVMARPPGKRISTIHLLSGGEKALTSVALIFAIFELNPAPFCMLDEVDAPLDDANVMRFCDIVRDMSDRVQFVVITHNKTTIEMASHLTGVTMQEAGVSRLVAVDVDEAVQLAAM